MSVTDLPCELLIEAFAFCAILDHFAPLTLSSVCTHWRRVVQSSPRVWQFVLLDDTRSTAVLHAQSQLWIKRSAPLNFDVHLRLQSSENILPLLSPFLPVLHRWRQLVISGEHEETVHFPDLVSRLDTLSDLSISICSVDHVDNHPSLSTFAPYSPVWPNRINMHVQLSKLPTSRDMHPLRFTSISITEHGSGTHTKASAVLSFLQACPHLQHFCLTGLIHRDDHSNEQLPVAFLPNLKSLQLRGTCLTRSILSSIDTPSLNKLYLSHLNVDFPLPGTYRDIGDSDDEANDFSQSPWSDRAIGMGLRNLISRCNPPIKKLEMDFSDMRTKDFVWVFDRLKLLEDFLIVASDMSDTVMKLLRPFGPAEDAVGVEMETNPCLSPAPTHQVRLPRLRTLDLYNCHRLSGEVIVDTLISRTKYTDRYTPEETLEEITIVDCDRFTQQHGDMLLKEIGTRVRIE